MRRDTHLKREAAKLGFVATISGGNHLRFTHPDVPQPIFAALTPSCSRAHKNALSLMRRMLRANQKESKDL